MDPKTNIVFSRCGEIISSSTVWRQVEKQNPRFSTYVPWYLYLDIKEIVRTILSAPGPRRRPCSPVVSGVPDGSLAAQPVALLEVEGVVPVGVIPRLQLLPGQVCLLIEAAQQLALLLHPRGLGHLQRTQHGVFTSQTGQINKVKERLND